MIAQPCARTSRAVQYPWAAQRPIRVPISREPALWLL